MLTKRQVLNIGKYYIEPLFNKIRPLCSIDSDETLTNGHCYYYAKRLNEFLQGEWKYRDISSLTDEEKEKRKKETGRICSVDDTHYFVEYDGNYYDGKGAMWHTDKYVTLWEYEHNFDYDTNKKSTPIDKIFRKEYGDPDDEACFCMNYYKTAVWDIYDIIFKPFEKEMISKLESASKDNNDVGFDAILNIYFSKSLDLFENDPSTKIKIDEILENLEIKDKEHEEELKRRSEELKEYQKGLAERFKSASQVGTWGNMTPEEYEAYVNSEEFKARFEKFFPGTKKDL